MLEQLVHQAGIISYVTILICVSIYGFHRYVLVYLYLKHRNKRVQAERAVRDAAASHSAAPDVQ